MELTVEAEAFNLRLKDQRNHDLWLAWHIGAFSRCERLPDLKDLLDDPTPLTEEEERKRNQAGIMSASTSVCAVLKPDGYFSWSSASALQVKRRG